MRKSLTLLLVLIAALLTTARASAPENGKTCYLYNVGQQKWLSAAADGTLTLGDTRVAVTLATVATQNGSTTDANYFTLTTAQGKICSSLLATPRCDGSVPYDQWRFDEVSGKPGVYTLANRYRDANSHYYMYYSTLLGALFTEPLKPWTSFENAQWQLLTDEDIPTQDVYLSETAESYTAPTVQSGHQANVYLQRTLTIGQYNSFCVPFDITREQLVSQFGDDVHVIHLDSYDGSTVNFVTYTGDLKAGEPYHIKPSETPKADFEGNTCYKFTGITEFAEQPSEAQASAADGSSLTYYATFVNATAPKGAYVISRGDIYHLQSDMALMGFRGYFLLSGSDKAAISTYVIDGGTSGIGGIDDFGSASAPRGVYNTAGQKMAQDDTKALPKGVYVINGKKVIK